ncbi:MAG TPA: CPBP family intramembrane glutamic endopeptidase [Gemmatimonadales bacterium]
MALAVTVEFALLALAVGAGLLLGVSPLEVLDFGWADLALGFGATVPLVVILLGMTRLRWRPIERLVRSVETFALPLFSGCGVPQLVLVAVAAGVGEEALFRGLLQGGLAAIGPTPVAVVMTAALFGLVHFVSVGYAVAAGLVGLYLGVLVTWTGGLVSAMVAHATYDFVALLFISGRLAPLLPAPFDGPVRT